MSTSVDIAQSAPSTSRAVIIGAGIAGLLAARVLSDFFAEVILIERDRLPDRPQSRPGVPQSAHGHLLLVGGVRTIAGLFPGIERQLEEAGAIPGDTCSDGIVNVRGRRLPRFSSDLKGLLLSRNLLEWQIRQRVTDIPNVTVHPECKVMGLVFDRTRSRVTGVRVSVSAAAPADLMADVVVDASGRRSVASNWLGANGIAEVPETIVDAHVGYVSRRFCRPPVWTEDWKVAAISWFPPDNPCAGGIYPEENDVWIASLVGALDAIPANTEENFLGHARRLEDPVLYDVIRGSKPLSKIVGYRVQGSRRRTFSRLSRRLRRLIVIGDALCTVNPFYGQGMTIAALQARALQDQFLRAAIRDGRSLDQAVCRVQRACEKVLTVPWLFSTTEDFRHGAGVDGDRTVLHRVTSWYVDRAIRVQSERTTKALYRTMGMVDHYALLRPSVVLDILFIPIFRQINSVFSKGNPQ